MYPGQHVDALDVPGAVIRIWTPQIDAQREVLGKLKVEER